METIGQMIMLLMVMIIMLMLYLQCTTHSTSVSIPSTKFVDQSLSINQEQLSICQFTESAVSSRHQTHLRKKNREYYETLCLKSKHQLLLQMYAKHLNISDAVVKKSLKSDQLWYSAKEILQSNDVFPKKKFNIPSDELAAADFSYDTKAEVNDSIDNDDDSTHMNENSSEYVPTGNNFKTTENSYSSSTSRIVNFSPPSNTSEIGITGNSLASPLTIKKLIGRLLIESIGLHKHNDTQQRTSQYGKKQDRKNNTKDQVRVSSNQKYLITNHAFEGDNFQKFSRTNKITVATQCSLDRLHLFVQSHVYWNGPISLAIFLDDNSNRGILNSYIDFLYRCHNSKFEQTRFTIATRFSIDNPQYTFNMELENFSCDTSPDTINALLKSKGSTKRNEHDITSWYPQNMMRNLARENVDTEYLITLDVDIMPCPQMSEKLESFLNTKNADMDFTKKHALVIPTYEVALDKRVKFPLEKHKLVILSQKGLAQPFHKSVYLPNQNATNFPKWESLHDSFQPVTIAHRILQFPVHYEPFFVEYMVNSPNYDENFVGYGFARSSHAYEVSRRNGDFLVLSPVYTVQRGLMKVKNWSEDRKRQNAHNQIYFRKFLDVLLAEGISIKPTYIQHEVQYPKYLNTIPWTAVAILLFVVPSLLIIFLVLVLIRKHNSTCVLWKQENGI